MLVATTPAGWQTGGIRTVSIPGGFSCSLRRSLPHAAASFDWQFQSLAGFRARCDFAALPRAGGKTRVSIPGGFSCSLRHWCTGRFGFCRLSFNPWRVFVLVATQIKLATTLLSRFVSIPGGFSCSLRLHRSPVHRFRSYNASISAFMSSSIWRR